MMNPYAACALINVSIIILTGLVIYWTGSLWGLLTLLFLVRAGTKDNDAKERD